MLVAFDSISNAAKKARIPVFTITPGMARRGGLFDFGANFYEVGRQVGQLAARILSGTDPSTIPIRDLVPRKIEVNTLALRDLKDPWKIPEELLASADVVVDESGVHDRSAAQPASEATKPLAKRWKLRLVEFVNVVDVEGTEHGVMAGLKESGLVEGRDYETKVLNAQGDMATVNSLVDAPLTDGADMLITLSTLTLQAAIQRAKNIPVVITYVASGVAAEAGKSDEDHLPNITGVYLAHQYEKVVSLFRECFPKARVIGTLSVPSEVNTVLHKEKLEEAAHNQGLKVIVVPVSTSTEVADAALSLCSQKPDAVIQVPGNLVASAFTTIAQAAKRARLPLFAFSTSQAKAGAMLVLSRDFYDNGREAGLLAARVMRGERPVSLPFRPVNKTKLIVNLEAARELTISGFASGMVAGAITGVLHVKFKIHGLLAGILVMTALYSVNLHVMGKNNPPLASETTLATYAEQLGTSLLGGGSALNLLGWEVGARDAFVLLFAFGASAVVGFVMYFFYRTHLGTAMRATEDNDQMVRALGVNNGNMLILGLSISNGLIALAGGLLAQYQGFADVQMGIGMVVWGLASVIIGEALVWTQHLGLTITGAVMGSVLFRLLVAIALRWGLSPNDLELITAVFVFSALVLPNLLARLKRKKFSAIGTAAQAEARPATEANA